MISTKLIIIIYIMFAMSDTDRIFNTRIIGQLDELLINKHTIISAYILYVVIYYVPGCIITG